MKALIFGANGQDGWYLSELCKRNNVEPVCVSRSGNWVRGDVGDIDFVRRTIAEHSPAYVFHLAANSTTRHSALFENHSTIVNGTLNILETVARMSLPARVFISGSGLQFANDGTPISERNGFEPSSAYALSRIQSVYAARYFRSLGVKTYVGYFFHHESPRRHEGHVSQLVASAARRIQRGSKEVLEIGDLSVRKEWTFAGDVVEAVWMLVNQDAVSEAVIGSGTTYSIQEWVETVFSRVGLDWRTHVREREGFKPEYKQLVSNPEVIYSLGWKPAVDFGQLAGMMVEATA
jgi:GDPmannose 4,6-dehydratase